MNMNEFQDSIEVGNSCPTKAVPDIYFLGLAAEAGEVATEFQRYLWGRKDINKEDMTSELGDVLWYVVKIAMHYGIEFEDIMKDNLAKRIKRNK